MYILLGYLALSSAAAPRLDRRLRSTCFKIPVRLRRLRGGLGLLAYAIYKFIAAVSDIEHHGADAKGVAQRTRLLR